MVLGEAVDLLAHRHQPAGGENAGLAHAAAEHLAGPAGLLDEISGANQDRAHRGAQALGQTERDRVEAARQVLWRALVGDRRVHQSGTIEVTGKSVLLGQPGRLGHVFGGQGFAIMGVLKTNQLGARKMHVVGLDPRLDHRQVDAAVVEHRHGLWNDPAKRGGSDGFGFVDVIALADDVLFTAPAMGQNGGEVRLRARRDVHASLEAEHVGDRFL